MQLRFSVNRAEAFRRGIDCPQDIVQIDVDPATLDEKTRRLITDRMKGMDICQLEYRGNGETAFRLDYEPVSLSVSAPVPIVANAPTFEALMEAINENEKEVQESRSCLVMSNSADQQAARMAVKSAATRSP